MHLLIVAICESMALLIFQLASALKSVRRSAQFFARWRLARVSPTVGWSSLFEQPIAKAEVTARTRTRAVLICMMPAVQQGLGQCGHCLYLADIPGVCASA